MGDALVRGRLDLREPLPPLPPLRGLELKVAAPASDLVRTHWPGVFSASFRRRGDEAAWRTGLIDHPHYRVLRTALLFDGPVAMGTMSSAVALRDHEVGFTHIMGLLDAYRGRGLGRFLMLWALHDLQERQVPVCEMETRMENAESLILHYRLGFRPKLGTDPWNTVDPSPAWRKTWARTRQLAQYARWRAREGRAA
jgi:GNAT superfamily N-acetyltransferase